jgi:hydrogenase maturation protein HypF
MKEKPRDINQAGKQPVEIRRLHLKIQGVVQGVGFRPFVYRTATRLGLSGWVNNSARGVEIDLEGQADRLNEFLDSLQTDKPPHSVIENRQVSYHEPQAQVGFRIIESDDKGDKSVLILPDIATCPDCLKEIFDPDNRRYMYPFTNCTNCGPRYSIIESLPYDRGKTTMNGFLMCEDCRAEYENPLDRRFHAQPNACPQCGPHLELWDKRGNLIASHNEALMRACEAVSGGEILALKGLGGFHLIVDARNSQAVKRLRHKKGRKEKPFALMYPNLEYIEEDCKVSDLERDLLLSAEAPIVLLRSKSFGDGNAPRKYKYIAPDNPYLGVMLPYTPLHHLLMANLEFPIVATSGNLSEEPICIDEHEALDRLGQVADLFLVHNRPIARHLDDSIVRIMSGRELVLRRARGYAPLPIGVENMPGSCLAVGGHQKNSVAIAFDKHVFISQHIGDLDTRKAFETFAQTTQSLSRLYNFDPQKIACDKHPDYLSGKYSRDLGLPRVEVQHHYAHVLSCMAENRLTATVLGVAWDGTGYGTDGTVWGGEFLKADSPLNVSPICERLRCREMRRRLWNRAGPHWDCCMKYSARNCSKCPTSGRYARFIPMKS